MVKLKKEDYSDGEVAQDPLLKDLEGFAGNSSVEEFHTDVLAERNCETDGSISVVMVRNVGVYVQSFRMDKVKSAIQKLFKSFGEIVNVVHIVDENGKCKGYAFMEYTSAEIAKKAAKILSNYGSQAFTVNCELPATQTSEMQQNINRFKTDSYAYDQHLVGPDPAPCIDDDGENVCDVEHENKLSLREDAGDDHEENTQFVQTKEKVSSVVPTFVKKKYSSEMQQNINRFKTDSYAYDQHLVGPDPAPCIDDDGENVCDVEQENKLSLREDAGDDHEENTQFVQTKEKVSSVVPTFVKKKYSSEMQQNINRFKTDSYAYDQHLVGPDPAPCIDDDGENVCDVEQENKLSLREDAGDDHEENTQFVQTKEKVSSVVPTFVKKKYSKRSENRQLKSVRSSELQNSCKERSNNDRCQTGLSAFQKGRQKPLRSSIDSSDDEFFDAHNTPNRDDKSSTPCESDSDLEFIPTASHFKQHIWRGRPSGRMRRSSSDEREAKGPSEQIDTKMVTKKPFGKAGYMEGTWKHNRLIRLDSCQFSHPDENKTVYVRKQHPGYLLTFDEEDFIARVRFDKLEDLDFAKHSIDTKREFFKNLTISEIIKDKSLNDRDTAGEQFKQLLHTRARNTADSLESAEDIFQLHALLRKYRNCNTELILKDIVKSQYMSSRVKDSSQVFLDREKHLDARKKIFPNVDQFYVKNFSAELMQICKGAVSHHKNSIFARAPSCIEYRLDDVNDDLILYITNKDMELFADLDKMMCEEPFRGILRKLCEGLLRKLEKIRLDQALSRKLTPLTHPIYFYLYKSFQELVQEISTKADMSVNDLLQNAGEEWRLAKTIKWLKPSPLNRCLEQQYAFVFNLMTHFEPGSYSIGNNFKYEFKLLQSCDDKSWVKKFVGKLLGRNKLSSVSQERLVWISILDSAISNILSKEQLTFFKTLLNAYTNFVEKANPDQYESLRVVTHNTARFVAHSSAYLRNGMSKIDLSTLEKQMESINHTISEQQFDDFRDVYNAYWNNRESIVETIPEKFPYGEFKRHMEKIRQKLLCIVNTVLSKKVRPPALIKCLRSFNEFLEDLSALEYSWIVKGTSDLPEAGVYLLNKDKNSYQVLEPEKVIKRLRSIPRHYLIEITDDILESVNKLLAQQTWSYNETLNAASAFLSAIRKSFCYLKEQPNYVSFDTFKEEITRPFACVVANCSSYQDFEERIAIIGESFWYLRKQDEIDIEKALELYRQENSESTEKSEETLRCCYNRYLGKFTSYIHKISSKNYDRKIAFITEEVNGLLKSVNFKKWEKEFKKGTLPELLAGLAAVWSVQASKDIGSTGKSLKPHCIQILCILRLLSVDKDSTGVDKHLAQVLTGQGKSLVLGLLCTILALTGHKVRTVCYSEYLATRDEQDFNGFFRQFGIRDSITYGTFEDMANETLQPAINGQRQGLRDLVKNRVLNHSRQQTGQIQHEDTSSTILLIDEVDVFFSDQFYGNVYGACTRIGFTALAFIQEAIWEMASKKYEKPTILKEVEEFTKKKVGERNEYFKEFNKFLVKPGKYFLLALEKNAIVKKEYENRSLYEDHAIKMIDCAIRVAQADEKDYCFNRYKLNDDGVISYRSDCGFYSTTTFNSYLNVFWYLRLKKRDYNHKTYTNYGYFIIDSGKISYAKLPEKYSLILGVSGTLTTLNDHERKVVTESYHINRKSAMPSYFGESNLKFDTRTDFSAQDSEAEWLDKIFNNVTCRVNLRLSVLVFFDTDIEIDKFHKKVLGKFDRLHTLTENTEAEARKKYIEEAGIAQSVTLATRGMGRGVDFKSSVAVERNGGVHVIQTFFSLDVKEETQIKGRTARKDNKGSYELILCKEHLVRDGFLVGTESPTDYQSLNKAREAKSKKIGETNEVRIKESEDNHNTTIDFLESFFGQ